MSTAEATTVERCGEWPCSNEEYHADCSRVGKSMLDDFRRSRRLYEARYVTKTLDRTAVSAAMQRGSMLHMRLLEPARYQCGVVVQPKFDRRTKAGKLAAEAFEAKASAADQLIVDAELRIAVESMAQAVLRNRRAAALLDLEGPCEHSIWWRDIESGIVCKSRRDKVADDLIIDLKTCESATPFSFAKAAAYYGYHRQAAFYLDGERQWRGGNPSFVFIAVSYEPPYQAACYELDETAIERGREENRENLLALAECYQSDEWSDPFERQITRIALPDWVHRDDWRMT